MAKLKFSFSPIFIVFGFVVIYFGWVVQFFTYLIVMLLHEMSHYVVARCFGYRLNKIIFMPYGAGLSGDSNIFKPSHEVVIALAGPLLNLVLVLVSVAFWWIYPISFAYTQLFVTANLVLGIFNLLPIFPLDGGRVLVALFANKVSKLKAYKVIKIVGLCFAGLFCLLFVVSAFSKLNLNFIFIAAFLATSSFNNLSNVYYERSYVKNFSNTKNAKPVEVKTFAVNSKIPVLKLIKYIKGNNYTQFVVLNDDGNVLKTINETELLNLLNVNKKTNN